MKATVKFDGPVAPLDVGSGNDLFNSIQEFDKNFQPNEQENYSMEEVVDFEHLNIKEQWADDDEDDAELMRGAAKAHEMSPSERKKMKDKQRKRILVKRQKQEQQRLHQHRKVREEGQPYQTTVKVPRSGWYRLCVQANFHQVSQNWCVAIGKIAIHKNSQFHGANLTPLGHGGNRTTKRK